jgi:hypothetical protein
MKERTPEVLSGKSDNLKFDYLPEVKGKRVCSGATNEKGPS